MEYPFWQCPKPAMNSKTDLKGVWAITQTDPFHPSGQDASEIVTELVKQTLKIQEECITLLNLLVEFVECQPENSIIK
jgi:hypothetical protein